MKEYTLDQWDHFLDELNRRRLPFASYRFVRGENGHMALLGRGGYAAVFECHGTRLDSVMAVKVVGLIDEITDPEEIDRYVDEGRLQFEASRLCNRIVQVEDIRTLVAVLDDEGAVADIQPLEESAASSLPQGNLRLYHFILMEKLEPVCHLTRKSIEIVLPRLQKLEEQEILCFAIDIATALREAHHKKMIHRDVKLENTFWDERNLVYKLGDFGIAREVRSSCHTAGAGTFGFMAPEVNTGRYGEKADIYSFGVMLYWLLNDMQPPVLDGITLPLHGSSGLKQLVLTACSYSEKDRQASMDEILGTLYELKNALPSRSAPSKVPQQKDMPDSKKAEAATSEEKPADEPALVKAEPAVPAVTGKSAVQEAAELPPVPAVTGKSAAQKAAELPPVPAVTGKSAAQKAAEQPVKQPKEKAPEFFKNKKEAAPYVSETMLRQERARIMRSIEADHKGAQPNPARVKREKTKRIFHYTVGTVGVLALLIGMILLEVILGPDSLPDPKAWQLYAAVVLSTAAGIAFFASKLENIIPVLWFVLAGKRKPLWVLLWLAAAAFDIYCCFALDGNWLIIVLTVTTLIGSFGLQWSICTAAVTAALFGILGREGVLLTFADWGWLAILLLGTGLMLTFCNFSTADFNDFMFWIYFPSWMMKVFIGITGLGVVIWLLGLIPSFPMPQILQELRLALVGAIWQGAYAAQSALDDM